MRIGNVSRQFVDGHPLRPDIGLALSCYERALFFSTTVPPKTGKGKPWERNDDDDIQDIIDPYLLITAIYARTASKLYLRLAHITPDYSKRRKLLKLLRFSLGDRDFKSILHSREILLNQFEDLAQSIEDKNKLQRTSGISRPVDEFRLDWKGLNNLCNLFMHEIAYLNSRIDHCNTTLVAIFLASVGFIVSIALSLATLIYTVKHDRRAARRNSRDQTVPILHRLVTLSKSESNAMHSIQQFSDQWQSVSKHTISPLLLQLQRINASTTDILKSLRPNSQEPSSIQSTQSTDGKSPNSISIRNPASKSASEILQVRENTPIIKQLQDLNSAATAILKFLQSNPRAEANIQPIQLTEDKSPNSIILENANVNDAKIFRQDLGKLLSTLEKLNRSLEDIEAAIKAEKAPQTINKAIFNIGGKLGTPR